MKKRSYVDKLPDLVQILNDQIKKGIGMEPSDVILRIEPSEYFNFDSQTYFYENNFPKKLPSATQ